MAQDADPSPSIGRQRSRALLDGAADRNKAFRRARRHTLLVRSLRWGLPLSAVAMVVGYAALMQRSIQIGFGDRKIVVDRVEISRDALVAHHPRYHGFDKSGSEFEVKAVTGEQDHRQRNTIRLKGIEGWLRDASRQTTTLKSPRGVIDTTTNILELHERIEVVSQNGMTAELTRATVFTRDSRIVSSEPVVVRMPSGTVRGKTMTIEQKRKTVLFSGGVVTHLISQPAKPSGGTPADPALRGSQGAAGLGRTDAPIDITSQQLLIDDQARTATFSGTVVARQADAVMETTELEVSYDGQMQGSAGAAVAPPAAKAAGDQQGRLRRLTARSDVVLTRGAERATGSSGEFDAVADRATLMGPVVISAGPDRGATADRADIDNKADTILLSGNVVVTQQKNELKGRRLLADRKNGTMRLESPANVGLPKGQISARLYQQDGETAKKPGPGVKAASAPGAAAGLGGPLAGALRADPSQPIEITADTLDVDDRKKVAIFRGRVRAAQGDYTIVTEELHASYTGDAGMALGAQPGATVTTPAATPAQKGGAQLKEVSAPRPVEIISKDGQRASGNSAIFDPKANTARLTGNVLLTQGKTATQGNCALLDMDTGTMKIVDACGYTQTAGPKRSPLVPAMPTPARQDAATPVSKGRAQAILFPGELQEEQKSKREQERGKAAGQPASGAAAEATPQAIVPAQRPPRAGQADPGPAAVFGN
jgi:LPS export ABC transporter protein LptC